MANVRLATQLDSTKYYGVQEVNSFMYYDSIQEYFQGNANAVEFFDLEILGTYTKDIILKSNELPQLFTVNVYIRSESDF